MADDLVTRLSENATGIASLIVTGLWLALMFSGVGNSLWLVVLLVGYIVVVPLVALLFGDEDDVEEWWDDVGRERPDREDAGAGPKRTDREASDSLETLRDRYARGELTDEQFERKLERLLETETLEDVADRRRVTRERVPFGTDGAEASDDAKAEGNAHERSPEPRTADARDRTVGDVDEREPEYEG